MAIDVKDKLVTVEGLGVTLGKDASGNDVESTYAKKDFSTMPIAPTPYNGNEQIALYAGGGNYSTTVNELLSAAGGGGGTSQGALVNYVKNCGTISSLPQTINDANITSDMVVLEAVLGNPAAQTGDWSVSTANGSVTISGSISGSTTLMLYFGVGMTAAPTLLTNLASTSADNILKTAPRPGVMGVLGLTNGGTGASTPAGAQEAIIFAASSYSNNAAYHNSIYRGKSLGSSLTTAQSTAITNGTFADMYIGDYWTINGVKYVIADFDPYYRCGDTISLGHHIAVIPASNMVSAAWNVDSNDTSKMYIKSDIRIVTLQGLTSGSDPNVDSTAGVQGTIISAFGSAHVLKYRALYPSVQSSGKATGWAWTDARVELLNEVEVYGTQAWTSGGNGNGYEIGINKRQLSIFRLDPTFCNIRAAWWLRGLDSASDACLVAGSGGANYSGASNSAGVRPLSLIA